MLLPPSQRNKIGLVNGMWPFERVNFLAGRGGPCFRGQHMMQIEFSKTVIPVAAALIVSSACGSSDPAPTSNLDPRTLVEQLASDEMNGRDNQSPGSALARELLIDQLSLFAKPVFPEATGRDGFLQVFDRGTNVLAVIPGGELADEFVMIGAHYDGKGNECTASNCDSTTTDDNIYNGATDNAAGVAVAIEVARAIAADGVPRRSILITLWDAEEDGLVGSRFYVGDPAVPLGKTVAYINMDIQGSNLLPSLATATVLVGAETGGPNLVEAASRAIRASKLDTVMLSLLFGQGRSDHANLVSAGVPSVFLTDANSGCYHTVKDDIDAVDFGKLEEQIVTAEALARDLVATDKPPAINPTAPITSYEDAAELLRILSVAQPDFALLGPEQEALTDQYLVDLQVVVDAGSAGFGPEANGILLGGAAQFVTALRDVVCDPFLPS